MTKHRFIFSGLVSGEDKISDYRLISSVRRYSLGQCVCVNIPDDMEINHYPGDGYSTVDDDRTLDELGWDCYFLYKGRWRKFNELKKYKPCEWSDVLEYIYGLYECDDQIGWTDDEKLWEEYWEEGDFKSEEEMYFPGFKEDKVGLDLKVNLKDYPFGQCDDDWYKEYQRLKEIG